jgi:hypothetical protein
MPEAKPKIDEAVRLYETGLSLARVGDRIGAAARTVQLRLRERGVQRRNSSGQACASLADHTLMKFRLGAVFLTLKFIELGVGLGKGVQVLSGSPLSESSQRCFLFSREQASDSRSTGEMKRREQPERRPPWSKAFSM